MKNFIFIMVLIGLSGCSRPMNKTIVEPLEADEIRQLQKHDTTFVRYYKAVQKMRESFLSDEVNQAKYGAITYGQLQTYCSYRDDTVLLSPVIDQARGEWQTACSGYDEKLDSIMTYWSEYMKANSLDSYLKLNLYNIEKEYYPYTSDVRHVNLAIELTPLKGRVQGANFTVEFRDKSESDDLDWFSLLFDRKISKCELDRPFSGTTVFYWEVGDYLKKKLADMTIAQVREKYEVVFDLKEIKVNNRKITNEELSVPASIQGYLKYPTLYKDDVIKELIDTTYLPEKRYVAEAIRNALKAKDGKCYDLLQAYDAPFMED